MSKGAKSEVAETGKVPGKRGPKDRSHLWKPGQSGNPKGRPVGTRVAFGELFMKDFHETWQKRGRVAIEEMDPTELVRVAARLLPAEVHVGGSEGGPVELVIRWGGGSDGDGGSGAG